MAIYRYAQLDSNNFVIYVGDADEQWGVMFGWIKSETAQVGDFWNGTIFITPPPPDATIGEYSQALTQHLFNKQQAVENGIRDAILAADPTIKTVAAFQAVLDSMTWPDDFQ